MSNNKFLISLYYIDNSLIYNEIRKMKTFQEIHMRKRNGL